MIYTVELLSLFSDPAYTMSVSLEEESFTLKFYLNTRTQLYHFDILNSRLEPVHLGAALLPLTDICGDLDLSEHGLTGFFSLTPRNANTVFEDLTPAQLVDNYIFFYASPDNEE